MLDIVNTILFECRVLLPSFKSVLEVKAIKFLANQLDPFKTLSFIRKDLG